MVERVKKLSKERILEAARESVFGMSDIGFCAKCGAEAYGVEPDAERYPCESCGARAVYGAEQLLLMVAF